MTTAAPAPPALPNIEVAVIDIKTGKMDVDWYKYFLSWDRINRMTRTGSAGDFTANGTVATGMTNLGPVGSHTTIQKWLTVKDNLGHTGYIPVF